MSSCGDQPEGVQGGKFAGPARAAPWRLQRWLYGGDPRVTSPATAAIGVGFWLLVAMLVAPSGNRIPISLFIVSLFLPVWAAIYFGRKDRHWGVNERLDQVVVYLPRLGTPVLSQPKQSIYVILVLLGSGHLFWTRFDSVRQGESSASTIGQLAFAFIAGILGILVLIRSVLHWVRR